MCRPGIGESAYVRRSPPCPLTALNLALSRSSWKSSSFTSPGVKTLPGSNSSFFSSFFFRFCGRGSACCCIPFLQLRCVGIEQIYPSPGPVVHDQETPINRLDIELVAQSSPKRCTCVRRRVLDRAQDRVVRRDPVEEPGPLPLVEQGALLADLGVLLARAHLDVRALVPARRVLDRVPPVQPLDPAGEVLRALALEAVEDLLEQPERALVQFAVEDPLDLPEVVPLDVDWRDDGASVDVDLPLRRVPDLNVVPHVVHGALQLRGVREHPLLHELQDGGGAQGAEAARGLVRAG